MKASLPRVIIEVLSASTRNFDTYDKVQEYQSLASVEYILLVEPNVPWVMVWSRDEDRAWSQSTVLGSDAVIRMPVVGLSLALLDIYDGVAFAAATRLLIEAGGSIY